ncbi:AGE family epimerase/isomerase [Heyndrickxia faecalis]
MDFKDPHVLKQQIIQILEFYYPACIDTENGGYINGFLDNGSINDRETKHLVGTSRFIYNFSIGSLIGGPEWCAQAAAHGIEFLKNRHRDKKYGGYFFELKGQSVKDPAKMTYGHAFALLAAAIADQAGIRGAKELIEDLYHVTEQHFWDPDDGLYRDEWDASWSTLSSYRGQNANMHMCEAMLTAYEATGEKKYLNRAYKLAESVCRTLKERSGGMIWENYTPDWQPDWTYHLHQTKDEFRPYGFIPGHQLEWSKLLMWLDRHLSEPWIVETAEELYGKAWEKGADETFGGIFFALSPQGEVIDTDKNYWVISEAIAASALLAAKTGKSIYSERYNQLFSYASNYLIDHQYGGWYKLLNRKNERLPGPKSAPPKTDYHPVAACYQALQAFSSS